MLHVYFNAISGDKEKDQQHMLPFSIDLKQTSMTMDAIQTRYGHKIIK